MKRKMTLALTAAIFSTRTILFAALLLLTPRLVFAAASVAIDSATVNSTANEVTVAGSDFKPGNTAPTVQLGTATLIVVTSSDTQIVADLPANLTAGTYLLTVSNSQGSSKAFDLTYGATGPTAPAAISWFGAHVNSLSGDGIGQLIPRGGTGELVVNSITLPSQGSYLISGQQTFWNQDNNDGVLVFCTITVPTSIPSPNGPVTGTVSVLTLPQAVGYVPANGFVTLPLTGYYVAETAPVKLTVTCNPNTLSPTAAFPSYPFLLAVGGGTFTALQTPSVTTSPGTGLASTPVKLPTR